MDHKKMRCEKVVFGRPDNHAGSPRTSGKGLAPETLAIGFERHSGQDSQGKPHEDLPFHAQ
jgi:hypothetical protein